MAETTIEQATCENCGADIRDNTAFCYKCGSRVVAEPEAETEQTPEEPQHITGETNGSAEPEISDETRSALDDLAEKLKGDDAENADLLAQASAERKKKRSSLRKKREMVWQAADDGSNLIFILATLFIVLVTAAIVFLLVVWK
jgi:hypothetical protein